MEVGNGFKDPKNVTQFLKRVEVGEIRGYLCSKTFLHHHYDCMAGLLLCYAYLLTTFLSNINPPYPSVIAYLFQQQWPSIDDLFHPWGK
jgi:hypothetical protein